MTSSTPTSKSEQRTTARALPGGKTPWWRRWLEPILVVTIIAALVTALVTGGSMAFQSLKGDIHASEARISARIDRLAVRVRTGEASLHEEIQASEASLHEEIQASEARLHEEIQASEARQNKRIDEVKTEIRDVKTEIRDVKTEIRDVKTELKQDNAELKADVKAMDNKMDRVLEALVAAKS